MLISHDTAAQIIFRQRPKVYIPTLLFTSETRQEIVFPDLITIETYVNIESTYRQGYVREGTETFYKDKNTVWVDEILNGDQIRIWLKNKHVLEEVHIRKVSTLLHKFLGKNGKQRGYHLNFIKGGVFNVDTSNQVIEVAVSPGSYGFYWDFTGLAKIPWYSIQRIEVIRPRYMSTPGETPNVTIVKEFVKFPQILTVKFR